MEDIAEFLARQAGKAVVEARNRAASEAALRNKAARTGPGGVPRPQRPPRTSAGLTAAPALPAVVAAIPNVERPAPPPPPPVIDLPFELPGLVPEPPHPSIALLAAFSGGTALLSGIVLAEALAPPVALRGSQLFDRLER